MFKTVKDDEIHLKIVQNTTIIDKNVLKIRELYGHEEMPPNIDEKMIEIGFKTCYHDINGRGACFILVQLPKDIGKIKETKQ